jgi:hypothetical protein
MFVTILAHFCSSLYRRLNPVATAPGSVFVVQRCQTFCLRGFGGHVFSGSEMQRRTNTEPGAVATGCMTRSSQHFMYNSIQSDQVPQQLSVSERTQSLLLPVPYLSTHEVFAYAVSLLVSCFDPGCISELSTYRTERGSAGCESHLQISERHHTGLARGNQKLYPEPGCYRAVLQPA